MNTHLFVFQVSTSRRTFNPGSIHVCVWYAATSGLTKCIWQSAISQHQFYLDRKNWCWEIADCQMHLVRPLVAAYHTHTWMLPGLNVLLDVDTWNTNKCSFTHVKCLTVYLLYLRCRVSNRVC